MKHVLHYHSQTEDQLSEIMLWYEEQQSGLGTSFLDEFDQTIKHICDFPEAVEVRRKKYRVVKIGKFPYVIVFELNKKSIEIYSITHTSRHPGKRFKWR